MRAIFVDDQDNFAILPSALVRVSLAAEPDDPAHPGSIDPTGDEEPPLVAPTNATAAEQRAYRDTEGLMALCRAMALIKARSPGFAAIAEACRDQYLEETGDSLADDLFADFADDP